MGSVLNNSEIGTDYTDLEELARLGLDEEEIAILKHATDIKCHTPNPAEYHSSESVNTAGGISVADEIGMRGGRSGTMIPRATKGGGSQGFDANRPAEVNIIDIESGTKITLDFSAISNNQLRKVIDMNVSEDMGTVAALAFHRLAKLQKAGSTSITDQTQELAKKEEVYQQEELRSAPPGMGGAYVVPKANRGGSQQVRTSAARPRGMNKQAQVTIAPSVPPREPDQEYVSESNKLGRPVQQLVSPSARVNNHLTQQVAYQGAQQPVIQIHFECEGVYEMVAPYHRVAIGESCLVLAFDTRWTQSNKFEPKPTDDPIFLNIVGQPEIYRVYVSGEKWMFDYEEHQLYFIDEIINSNSQVA